MEPGKQDFSHLSLQEVIALLAKLAVNAALGPDGDVVVAVKPRKLSDLKPGDLL
jgi:hypothetical protein